MTLNSVLEIPVAYICRLLNPRTHLGHGTCVSS